MILALLCLAIAEPERKLREAKGKLVDGLRTIANIPLFRRAVLGYCAYTAAISAFAHWAPTYIARHYYMPQLAAELAVKRADFYFGVVTVVGGAVGTVIGGRWADRALAGMPNAELAYDARDNKRAINTLLRICAVGMVFAAPMTAICFAMPTPVLFFACAFLAEIGLFLSTSPVNAIALRGVPPELRASAMAGMIFAIHLFGDLWSPALLGVLNDLLISTVAMMSVPLVFALSAFIWWPRRREAE